MFLNNKKVICFIDDDKNELERFSKAMGDDYICITGQGYTDCIEKLKNLRLKPNLWILDLFFPINGNNNTTDQIIEMNNKYAILQNEITNFKKYLSEIQQDSKGGIELLKKCRSDYSAPVIMFTRKGTLEDAVECLNKGATAVLKKPMPAEWSDDPIKQKAALDKAMVNSKSFFKDKFEPIMQENTFFNKHRGIISFFLGIIIGYIIESILDIIFKHWNDIVIFFSQLLK